jgi:hypothetical protein
MLLQHNKKRVCVEAEQEEDQFFFSEQIQEKGRVIWGGILHTIEKKNNYLDTSSDQQSTNKCRQTKFRDS